MKHAIYILLLTTMMSCDKEKTNGQQSNEYKSPYENKQFAEYWDQGKAELNHYTLTQSRYGEERKGRAVVIFVTEDFSKSKQVKLDNPSENQDDAQHVLKMNFTKKFLTGLYPYSMMLSVFSPLDGSQSPLKVTTTSQEWCGHTFTQLNKKGSEYRTNSYSYFEKEGDQEYNIDAPVVIEDAIWNLIRTNPDELPLGEVKMLPGTLYQRLSHKPLEPLQTTCELTTSTDKNTDVTIRHYIIKQPSLQRTFIIDFEESFPYKITGWQEEYPGINGKMCATTGTLEKQIMLDYWNHHSLTDSIYRDSLSLPK